MREGRPPLLVCGSQHRPHRGRHAALAVDHWLERHPGRRNREAGRMRVRVVQRLLRRRCVFVDADFKFRGIQRGVCGLYYHPGPGTLQAIDDAVLACNLEGRVVLANEAAQRLLGRAIDLGLQWRPRDDLRRAGCLVLVWRCDLQRRPPGLLPVLEPPCPMYRPGRDLRDRRRHPRDADHPMRRRERLRRWWRVLPLVQQGNEQDRLSVREHAARHLVSSVQALVRVPRGKDVQRRRVQVNAP